MKQHNLVVSPDIGYDDANLKSYLERRNLLSADQHFRIERRSIDARQKNIKINLSVAIDDQPLETTFVEYFPPDNHVADNEPVIIVGAGPGGLFAALKCIELGLKPIILERGKDVRARRRDLAAINKAHFVNEDSNYCFGEGGAGTYSDGKLYTRSKKRGNVRRVFEILVAHGATPNILFEAHPHIGTNKLPKIVTALRESILEKGGEIHFNQRVTDILLSNDAVQGVVSQDSNVFKARQIILATGHSARDIYHLLYQKNIAIDPKPFALGMRIEHPQGLIDEIQYHGDRGNFLPPSAYSIACQTKIGGEQRGMFSFCMCPGGFIVPAATAPEELVVNGMSPSRRDGRFANSGIVVAIELQDVLSSDKKGPLSMLDFQAEVEKHTWQAGGSTQTAPAQRLMDFLQHKPSQQTNETSYQPGLTGSNFHQFMPGFVTERLQQGFKIIKRKMPRYLTNEAQLIGVESRTSAPIRIPRDPLSLEHPQIKGLFPCGEGAGYAGGIVSAAIDGENCAIKVGEKIKTRT